MSDVVIPPQYRARVKQRLKVLAYVKNTGDKAGGRHFALSRGHRATVARSPPRQRR